MYWFVVFCTQMFFFCYFTSLTRSYVVFVSVWVSSYTLCVLIQWVCVRIHTKLGFLLLFEHQKLFIRLCFIFNFWTFIFDIWLWLKQFKSIIDSQTSSFINGTKVLHTILSLVTETKEIFCETSNYFHTSLLFNRNHWTSHTSFLFENNWNKYLNIYGVLTYGKLILKFVCQFWFVLRRIV